jgi:hypothetical protein
MVPAPERTWFSLALCATLAACATGGAASSSDGGNSGNADAPVGAADAPVGAADAPPGGPDAPPGTPDAMMAGAPDAAPTCSPCQLVAQCGCAADQACDLGGANPPGGTTACRPITVQGAQGATCNGSTTCAAGNICLGGAGAGQCLRFCGGDMQCQGGGGLCAIQVTSGGTPIPSTEHASGTLHVCSLNCTPNTGAGCPSGFGCGAYFTTEQSRDFTDCFKAGAGVQNATCAGESDCASGFTCPGDNKCHKWCPLPAGTGCTGGTTCLNLVDSNNNPIVVAGQQWGVCG